MMNSKRYWILNDKMKDNNGLITWNGLLIPSDSEFLENNNLNWWWILSDIEFSMIMISKWYWRLVLKAHLR